MVAGSLMTMTRDCSIHSPRFPSCTVMLSMCDCLKLDRCGLVNTCSQRHSTSTRAMTSLSAKLLTCVGSSLIICP